MFTNQKWRDLNLLSRRAESQHLTVYYLKNLWTLKQWDTRSLNQKKSVFKSIRERKREAQRNHRAKENNRPKEAEKGTMCRRAQTRQIMKSLRRLLAAKVSKIE